MDFREHPLALEWIAAGVRHAVLARTMPVLRHELAGSVSVLRMSAAVLKRRLDGSSSAIADVQALRERADQFDNSIAELGDELRRLRHWDKPTTERLTPTALLNEAWKLSQPFLAFRNIAQDELPPTSAAWDGQMLAPQPFLYLSLAAIYHLAEALDTAPECIRAQAMAHGLRLEAVGGEPHVETAPPPPTPPIDLQALQCLASQSKAQLHSVHARCIELVM